MPAPALRCRGVTKTFASTVALDDFDLTVTAGSITALLGPSGCGKTTALRLVAGLETPDDGAIEIHGVPVVEGRRTTPPEDRRVGMVFQDYALFPHLTVARNVAYGLHQLPPGDRATRVAQALDLVGLADLGDRFPTQLSGGQQQRVALARALAPRPALVLLDEPFSNLDAALRVTVREEVRTILRRAGATALFVTHDQEEALSLADEVAVMHAGRLHQLADPETLYRRPATRFVAEFVGEADVISGRRAGRGFVDTPLGRLATAVPVDATDVAVMIRPESLQVRPQPGGAATVESIQYFGHDQLITVVLRDGTTVRSRRGPELRLGRGDRVDVRVDERVVVFADAGPAGDASATVSA